MPVIPPLTRTRIAPTPSGYLHLGNVFAFALTAVLAQQHGARILLRIDDLDRLRMRPDFVNDIFETLRFLGIPWHEGPANYPAFENAHSQVHRMEQYQAALQQLRNQDLVFACDCSRTQLRRQQPAGVYTGRCKHRNLPLDGEGYCWRIHTDRANLPPSMSHFIVRKKDGMPAYQLTSLVDDMHFGVDLIVRGQDLCDSTAAQRFLAGALGYRKFADATFVHHTLLRADGGEKLSKSDGATSVHYLRHRAGYTKGDIYQAVGRLAGLPPSISSWQDLAPSVAVFILPVEL